MLQPGPDPKVVTAALEERTFPELAATGFERCGKREFRRHHSNRIDLVAMKSLGKLQAKRFDLSPASFNVELSVYYPAICDLTIEVGPDGRLAPEVHHGQERGGIHRTIRQFLPDFGPEILDRRFWFVDFDAAHLRESVDDVARHWRLVASTWFAEKGDLKAVVDSLQKYDSPAASLQRGCLLLELHDLQGAERELRKALASGCYDHVRSELESKLLRAQAV